MKLRIYIKNLCKFTLFLLIVSGTSLIFPNSIHASTTLFDDNFTQGDGSTTKWDVIGYPGWKVKNQEYGLFIGSPGTTSNSVPKDNYWNTEWKNIIYEVDLKSVKGVDKNLLIEYQDNNNYIELHHNTNGLGNLEMVKRQNGVVIQRNNKEVSMKNGETHHFKIIINGGNIKVYLDENMIPVFDVDDNVGTALINWRVGLRAGTGSVYPTEVWFDNVKVTSIDNNGPFELPFAYDGRGQDDNQESFTQTFLNRYTSLFDHNRNKGVFTNFQGDTQDPYDRLTCLNDDKTVCYDGHDGVDFSKATNSDLALPVADGEVVYRSEENQGQGNGKCIPKVGYGCVVIIKHPTDDFGDIYGLYAHLDEIYVSDNQQINDINTQIGKIGRTGGTSTGEHLHFSAMKMLPAIGLSKYTQMSRQDWSNIVNQISSRLPINDILEPKGSVCTYTAPNGLMFEMLDPNGWKGEDNDPWSLEKPDGCGIENNSLWKYSINLN